VRKLILRWAINAAAVYVAVAIQAGRGISVEGGWTVYFAVALILGLMNAIIAPLLKALTCPLILLTLGLFTLAINGIMLWLTGLVAETLGLGFRVNSFMAAFLGALVISVVSFVLSVVTGVNRDGRRR
jgi:putative membrane protein